MQELQISVLDWNFPLRKISLFLVLLLCGCASAGQLLGIQALDPPPEFNQKVLLEVSGDFQMFQAPRSVYDVGDLQNFHTQHTLPIVVEDAFNEIFGEVEMVEKGPKIETDQPDVPAIFEVRLLDVANDIYIEADNYRGQVTLAVAMKSPRGHIFWQKAFRGDGFAYADPQFGSELGPQDAVVDAARKAIEDMQRAIISSPEVRTQLKYYQAAEAARRERELKV